VMACAHPALIGDRARTPAHLRGATGVAPDACSPSPDIAVTRRFCGELLIPPAEPYSSLTGSGPSGTSIRTRPFSTTTG
jgi:hypothetical protein